MDKVICKNCGCENTSDDIFCKNCGKMIMTSEYIENTDEKKPENSQISDDVVASVPSTPEEFDNIEEVEFDPKRNKIKIIVISAIVAVVLIIAAVVGLFATGVISFSNSDAVTEEVILTDLNQDNSVTTVKIGKNDVEFKVASIDVKNKEIDKENKIYTINLDLVRQNNELEVVATNYNVVYKSAFGTYKYDSANVTTDEAVTLRPLTGVSVETAQKKVAKIYDGITFKKQDTDLEKGVDNIYFDIDNDTNEGTLCAVYVFDNTKGWKFKEINEDDLGFKAGVSHKEDGLYTNTAVRNIMFYGVDAESYGGRSDCMMLVSIDTNTSKIKLTSFLRDTYVQIPGYGGNKLNSAFALGGAELATSAIENTYGIKIDNYAATNFTTFKNVINSLGGVNVNISADNSGKFFDFEIKERQAPDHGEWSQGYSSAGAWIISVNNWDQLKGRC